MRARAIIRVICDDGPFKGVQYMDENTGRILFTNSPRAARCIYQLDASETSALAASFPHARLAEISEADEEQVS